MTDRRDKDRYFYDGWEFIGEEDPTKVGIVGGYLTSAMFGAMAYGINEVASESGENYFNNLDFAHPFSLTMLSIAAIPFALATRDVIMRIRDRRNKTNS